MLAGKEKINLLTRPFYKVYRKVCKWAFGVPDLVIFPSAYLKKEYDKHHFFANSERVVLPNPAPDFSLLEKTERLPGALRLLFVGQLEEHKGIKLLLNAFEKIDFEAQLIIAGEGTEIDYVKEKAAANKNITYLGYVSVEQLINCLEIADALVVPSLCYENSPTVIYEALQAGLPVLAANIGGVGELVQNGKNGFLFKPNDESDLIAAIKQLDYQKERFGRMKSEIRKTVAPYNLQKYRQKLTAKIVEVIERKH
ncbi:glycosyltransferase [Candidatus Parcubacteria bacterium]|nr:MAG: glycosyltransferase [Candidatus Parcubacteria bacterium]